MTKGPPMADETEWGQLIPQSFSVANKVVAAHYGVTLLNSWKSTTDLRGVDKFKPPAREKVGAECRQVWKRFEIRKVTESPSHLTSVTELCD